MAVTAATKTTDFSGFIPAEIAAPIFERAARMSVFQQLARQVPLSYAGVSIPVVTGRPTANWVAEGAAKPATKGTMTLATMAPQKLAAIAVVSAEVVRANPGSYVTSLREQLAEAFAIAFDQAVAHDIGGDGTAGGGPFSTYLDQTNKTQEIGVFPAAQGGTYQDLVNAIAALVESTDASGRRYRATGFALDTVAEPLLLSSVDTVGRPLWIDVTTGEGFAGSYSRPGMLIGRPSVMGEGVATLTESVVGYLGDFTQAAWGVVGGISFDTSTEASVTINGTLTSLFENNLVAIRAEAEYGWVCADVNAFVKLTNTTS